MKKRFQFPLFFFLLIFLYLGQEDLLCQKAPLIIENWEGDGTFKEFSNQHAEDGDNIYEDIDVHGEIALEGKTSLRLSWKIKSGQYFFWGIDLKQGSEKGIDVHEAKHLSFMVKLETGDEKFEIKIKDTKGVNPGLNSNRYIAQNTSTQTIRIPLSKFGGAVDLFSLENISLDFDKSTSGKEKAIIIDDFKFEFQ